jgi:hypothetical protein
MVWSTDDFVSGYSYHASIRTGLPDHTMQTKFRIQQPRKADQLLDTGVVSHREEMIQCLHYNRIATTCGQSVGYIPQGTPRL